MGDPSDERTIYASKALTTQDWQVMQAELLAQGWELIKQSDEVVYLRRPFTPPAPQ